MSQAMSDPTPQTPKKIKRKGLIAAAVLIAVVAVSWPAVQARIWIGQLQDHDPKVRIKACQELGSAESVAAVGPLTRVMLEDDDRQVVRRAAYALMKIKHPSTVDALQKAAQRDAADDLPLAELILWSADLSEGAVVDFVRQQAASDQPWRRLGGGAGLMECGEFEGGRIVLAFLKDSDPAKQIFATEQFQRFAEPMTEMVGEFINLQTPKGQPLSPGQIAAIESWWTSRATPRLLRDFVAYHRRPNPKWREIKRLVHARQRVARWMGVDESAK
jgi:hypothetical protein